MSIIIYAAIANLIAHIILMILTMSVLNNGFDILIISKIDLLKHMDTIISISLSKSVSNPCSAQERYYVITPPKSLHIIMYSIILIYKYIGQTIIAKHYYMCAVFEM